jgi:hypothetical protein
MSSEDRVSGWEELDCARRSIAVWWSIETTDFVAGRWSSSIRESQGLSDDDDDEDDDGKRQFRNNETAA